MCYSIIELYWKIAMQMQIKDDLNLSETCCSTWFEFSFTSTLFSLVEYNSGLFPIFWNRIEFGSYSHCKENINSVHLALDQDHIN